MPTLEEIELQLEALAEQRKELQKQKKLAEKGGVVQFAQSVVEYILANEFDPREVANEIRRSLSPRRTSVSKTWALRSDSEKTYSRGPIPTWMLEEMEACGFDASSSSDRQAFRAAHMVELSAEPEQVEDESESGDDNEYLAA